MRGPATSTRAYLWVSIPLALFLVWALADSAQAQTIAVTATEVQALVQEHGSKKAMESLVKRRPKILFAALGRHDSDTRMARRCSRVMAWK